MVQNTGDKVNEEVPNTEVVANREQGKTETFHRRRKTAHSA